MSSGITHLEDDELLRLLDGELDDRTSSAGRAHVETCWTCRTRMEELESAIGDYVRYRDATRSLIPPPPGRWKNLQPAMEQADRTLNSPRLASSRMRYFFAPRTAQWLAVAAALLIAFLLLRRFEHVPPVRAAELLRKAAAVEQTAPLHRIRIRTRQRTFTRPAALSVTSTSDQGDLERLFERAHFNWQDPLSARSFSAWHDQLPEKQDHVDTSDADAYVVRTTTSASELRQATLTLRRRDLRPTREMLEFVSETVEITDLPEPEIAGSPEPAMPAPASPAAPPRTAAPEPSQLVSHRELQVFSALHRIGADLGEPVELRQAGSRLIVTGTGLTPARQQQLRASLHRVPGVEVRFEDATPSASDDLAPGDNATSATAPLQLRLQALLGSRQSVEDFTNRALDGSDAMMARAHALRALAGAFPPEAENALDSADRGVLASLRNDHAGALAARVRELRAILKPVLPSSPGPENLPARNVWQASVQDLFTSAQNFDELLNRVLAGSDAAISDNDFQQIAAALARLDQQVVSFEQSIGEKLGDRQ